MEKKDANVSTGGRLKSNKWTTIMDKSVDTFEQNKRFLSASLRKFK